jgi:hypothetical protein
MSPFVKNTLRMGIPFGAFMGLFNAMQHDPADVRGGVVSGLVTGALFGVTMAAFLRSQQKRAATLRKDLEGEGLTLDAPANLGAAGGWLFLTSKCLVWVPHRFNIGAKRREIALPTITVLREVTGYRRGMEVGISETERYLFVVGAGAKWIEAVGTAVAAAGGNARTLAS